MVLRRSWGVWLPTALDTVSSKHEPDLDQARKLILTLSSIVMSHQIYRYQVIFIFCGVTTFLYGLTFLVLMPDSPMEAKYLSEREQLIAVERLRANQMGVASRKWRWDHALETLLDLKTWLWFFIMTSIS